MNRDNLKVALLPLDIDPFPENNFRKVGEVLPLVAADTDILVLPELFSTGFYIKPATIATLADSDDGPTLKHLRKWASEYGFAIAGSFLAAEADGHYYNRAFFIKPSGEATFYNKRHLFSPGSEGRCLTPGIAPIPVIDYREWKIALSVCYDLRFPVWTRNKDYFYDVMIIPANWPVSRSYAWHHLLIARAIENQAAWIGCNRSGSDKGGDYDGTSQVYDATGHPIGRMEETTGIMYAEISREVMEKYRKSLPTYLDADSFTIQIP